MPSGQSVCESATAVFGSSHLWSYAFQELGEKVNNVVQLKSSCRGFVYLDGERSASNGFSLTLRIRAHAIPIKGACLQMKTFAIVQTEIVYRIPPRAIREVSIAGYGIIPACGGQVTKKSLVS